MAVTDKVDVGEFEAENKKRVPTCWFAVLPFTDEQRAKLDVVLDGRPDIKHATISRVLKKWNFTIDDGTVARHRRRGCSCPPRD
jgi:hypothetical protein